LSEPVRVVEKKSVPNNALLIHGLPYVGLVGLIATSHIIGQLKMNEIAYFDSELLPPVMVLHEGLPYAPLRILGNNDLNTAFKRGILEVQPK